LSYRSEPFPQQKIGQKAITFAQSTPHCLWNWTFSIDKRKINKIETWSWPTKANQALHSESRYFVVLCYSSQTSWRETEHKLFPEMFLQTLGCAKPKTEKKRKRKRKVEQSVIIVW